MHAEVVILEKSKPFYYIVMFSSCLFTFVLSAMLEHSLNLFLRDSGEINVISTLPSLKPSLQPDSKSLRTQWHLVALAFHC